MTEISSTTVHRRTAWLYASISMRPSSLRNSMRLSEARLQAVSSRNMYSEHGLDALMRPDSGQVCHSLMVVSNWTPGSAEAQAARPILSQRSRAFRLLVTLPLTREIKFQSPFSKTALMKSLLTRTELLEFWPETVR